MSEPDDVVLHLGDCLQVMPSLGASSFDTVITDPPYGLKFMGKDWDHGVPGVPYWEVIRNVTKPGGYLLTFGGTRTYHRLACAVEDAGFEVRDCLMWVYGSGFPKGQGCLKPAWEPILLCRKPGPKVLPLGIDECRVEFVDTEDMRRVHEWLRPNSSGQESVGGVMNRPTAPTVSKSNIGRYPANVVHDGSDEVLEAFAEFGEKTSGKLSADTPVQRTAHEGWDRPSHQNYAASRDWGADSGSAARFFYCAKASREERGKDNKHPTVKPLALMRWLVKLTCPPCGVVLDPFMGSGTTAAACLNTGRRFTGIELDPTYFATARRRIAEARGQGDGMLFREAPAPAVPDLFDNLEDGA